MVDDKEEARYLLSALLTGHGHVVASATNGEEALAKLRDDSFDLVISDILMPVMDGFQLCREVRKDQRLKRVLFVFYTATYVQQSDETFALQLGADDFILKPAEPETFLARIQKVVDRANAKGWTPRSPELTDEADVLRLYSERLVAKLEKRTLDLDRELAERRKAEETVRRHAERLELLRAIDIAILGAQSPSQISEMVLHLLVSQVRPARASVIHFDEAAQTGTILAVRDMTGATLRPGDKLPTTAFGDVERLSRGEHRQVDDLRDLPRRTPTEEALLRSGIVSYVVVPLCAAGRLVGSLNLGFVTGGGVTQAGLELAREVGNQLAIAIRQTELRDEVSRHAAQLEEHVARLSEAKIELEESYRRVSLALSQTVHALAAAAEVRDPYTAGHQRRVTELAVAMAQRLHLSAYRLEGLRVAGLMHDIGKLAIPSEVLSKPAKLTETEFALIRPHPQVARDILSAVDFPWPVSDIVFQHHERLDGSGYPQGISGDKIILEARILAVADVVEAMASHRPYRPALGVDAALEEIRAGRGTRYDAAAVDACCALFESGTFSFTPTSRK